MIDARIVAHAPVIVNQSVVWFCLAHFCLLGTSALNSGCGSAGNSITSCRLKYLLFDLGCFAKNDFDLLFACLALAIILLLHVCGGLVLGAAFVQEEESP